MTRRDEYAIIGRLLVSVLTTLSSILHSAGTSKYYDFDICREICIKIRKCSIVSWLAWVTGLKHIIERMSIFVSKAIEQVTHNLNLLIIALKQRLLQRVWKDQDGVCDWKRIIDFTFCRRFKKNVSEIPEVGTSKYYDFDICREICIKIRKCSIVSWLAWVTGLKHIIERMSIFVSKAIEQVTHNLNLLIIALKQRLLQRVWKDQDGVCDWKRKFWIDRKYIYGFLFSKLGE
ncbi:hypothetical protein AGLY_004441 [Aphis glycines]|uniref:Uncharacterized protein n=1 Tax=Aphis glycines TaxID=307491 RepID=A0A6G0TY55_APHGL|nr:hypothetical protein AGLY_004441 [Aphis glycines]